jgi:hypothetical protein
MLTVGKSQDPAWKHVLDTKGLSAAATILEEYGLSCESDMSLVDEEDLAVLCSKLKPFQSKLLRKWVQGLGAEQGAAAFMKDEDCTQAAMRGESEKDGKPRVSARSRHTQCFLCASCDIHSVFCVCIM